MVTDYSDYTTDELCKFSGEPIDSCFCPECLRCDENPPWHQWDDNEIETTNAELTVQYVREQIKLMTETVRKANRTMAFNVKGSKASSGGRGGKKANGIPFLDIGDLSKDKKRCKISWAGDPAEANNNQDWAAVSMKITSEASGMKRLWTLGENNPSFEVLANEMGEDAEQWIGREVFLFIEEHPVTEQKYIRVEVIPAEESKKKAATK